MCFTAMFRKPINPSVPKTTYIFRILFFVLSFFFVYKGVKWVYLFGILDGSTGVDFQWSGAKVFGQGINPYWLMNQEGALGKTFILAQGPSYLHFLYPIIAPLGSLKFEISRKIFVFINTFLFFGASLFLSRSLKLSKTDSFIVTVLGFGMPAFGHCLGNGQLSLFIFFALIVGMGLLSKYDASNILRKGVIIGSIIYGLSYAKWGYLPGLFSYVAVAYGFRVTLLSLIPSITGVILFLPLKGNIVYAIFGPLLLIQKKWAWGYIDVGMADISTFVDSLFYWRPDLGNPLTFSSDVTRLLPYLCAILSVLFVSWFTWQLKFKGDSVWKSLSVSTLIILILTKHLAYDNILILIPLAYILSCKCIYLRERVLYALPLSWFWIYPYFSDFSLKFFSMRQTEIVGVFLGILSLVITTINILQIPKDSNCLPSHM